MEKCPFERVLSLVERKRIFGKTVNSRNKALLKTHDGQVGLFQPMYQFPDGALEGQIYADRTFSKKRLPVLILLTVVKDRYFLNSEIVKTEHGWRLEMSSSFYILNRRNSFRVAVPSDLDLALNTTYASGATIRRAMPLTELGVGGGRIRVPHDLKLRKGGLIRGLIDWEKTRNLPVEIQLVHSPAQDIWGFKFHNMDSLTLNRMKLL